MGKITLILGGARSGKSSYAIGLAKKSPGKTAFIATCRPSDNEMKKRVLLHKRARPEHWSTFEETQNLPRLLKDNAKKFEITIIDCLTLLISDFMLRKITNHKIEAEIHKIIDLLKENNARSFIVSNEVGLGIVPQNRLTRSFRDIAGRVNQVVAKRADNVIFMVSGIPWRIK